MYCLGNGHPAFTWMYMYTSMFLAFGTSVLVTGVFLGLYNVLPGYSQRTPPSRA